MARIQEYDSSEALRGLQPSETGVEATAQAARRAGALGSETGTFIKRGIDEFTGAAVKLSEEHFGRQEILQSGKDEASAMNTLNDSWNAYRNQADPHDPTISSRWVEEQAKPFLESAFSGPTISEAGQRSRLAARDRLLEQFTRKSIADTSIVNGQAAKQDLADTGNLLSQSVVKNPDDAEHALAVLDTQYGDYAKLHGNLSAEETATLMGQKARFQKEIAKAAVRGLVIQDPEGKGVDRARAVLNSDRFSKYLDGNDTEQLDNYLKVEEDSAIRRKDARIKFADYEERQAAETDAGKLFMTIQPGAPVPAEYYHYADKFLEQHPTSTSLWLELRNQAIKATEQFANKTFVTTNDSVKQGFISRMYGDDETKIPGLEEILRAGNSDKLSVKDTQELQQEIRAIQGNKVMKAQIKDIDDRAKGFAEIINPRGLAGPLGLERYKQFLSEVHSQAFQKVKDGTVQDLLKQDSPYSLQSIAQKYKYDPNQDLQDRINLLRGENFYNEDIQPVGKVPSLEEQKNAYFALHKDDPTFKFFKPAPNTPPTTKAAPQKSIADIAAETK